MFAWDNAEKWIHQVTSHVRFRAARPAVHRELKAHIEDAASALTAGGMNEEDAVEAAVLSMGDAAEVGGQLDTVWRPKRSFALPACAVALWAVGFIAQGICGVINVGLTVLVFLVAAGAFFCFSRLPVDFLASRGGALYVGYLISLFFLLTFSPFSINGVNFFGYGNASFSCAYFFLFFPPFYALLISRLQGKGLCGILLAGCAILPVLFLAGTVPSVEMAFVCAVCGLVLLTGAVLSGKMGCTKKSGLALIWVPTLLVFWLCIFYFILRHPYFSHRLNAFLHPEMEPLGAGWQTLMVREVLQEAGGFFGVGSAVLQKLPDAAGGFLLTAFIGSLGWWVLGVVVALLLALLCKGAVVANRQHTLTGGLLAASVVLALGFQSVLFILANLALIPPLSALPIPFFSNVSTLFSAMLVGILAAALRWDDLLCDPPFSEVKKVLQLQKDGSLVIRFR